MALRVELIGPYCLILAMSSVCADQLPVSRLGKLDGANVSTIIDCGCLLVFWAWQHARMQGQKVIG